MSSRLEKLKEKLRKRNASRDQSPLEKWVLQWLPIAHIYNYKLEHQVEFYFIDVAFLDQKLAVELDGWEFHKDRKDQDEKKDEFLRSRGWSVVRVPSRDAWIPKNLAPYLMKIRSIIYPGDDTVPSGIAEIMGMDLRQRRMKGGRFSAFGFKFSNKLKTDMQIQKHEPVLTPCHMCGEGTQLIFCRECSRYL